MKKVAKKGDSHNWGFKQINDFEIRNRIKGHSISITFKTLIEMLLNDKIVSIKEFLQRQLLVDEWSANDYERSRSYIASLFKGTYLLDGFSIVPIGLVVEKLEQDYEKTGNPGYQSGIKLVKHFENSGVEYISLDGQNRMFLAILNYVKGVYGGIGKFSEKVDVIINGVLNRNLLKNTKYLDLPYKVREYLDEQVLTFTVVTDFWLFQDIIDTLLNKQNGISWAKFQEWKQSNRFVKYVIDLIDIFDTKQGKEFTKLYRTKLKSPKTDFKHNRDGNQYLTVILSELLQSGTWRNNVSKILNGPENLIKSDYKKIFQYCSEILKCRDVKTSLPEMINWVVFRFILDGGKKGNRLYDKIGHLVVYKPKNVKKLLTKFMKHHITIKGSESKPHPLSWFFNDETKKYQTIENGYSHSQNNQSTVSITNRMEMFFNSFPFNECIDEGILTESRKYMPSKEEIAQYNDYKDVFGKPLDVLNLDGYDGSHLKSKHNGGSNRVDNVGLEDPLTNRGRGSDDIDDTQLKLDF